MSNLNSLFTSGSVQVPSQNNSTPTVSTSTSSTVTTVTTDFDIFPVGNTINAKNFIYDGQTNLFINSTVNQNANLVKLQYFDPATGYPNTGSSFGFSGWNYDLVNTSYLNASLSSSSTLSSDTYMYQNLQPLSTSSQLAIYNLDISDAGNIVSSGDSSSTMFFSLTSQPYISSGGTYYVSPATTGTPGVANINPGYSSSNSDSFLFTSSYYKPGMNEIIIIQLVFNIMNTNTTNVYNATSGANPNSTAPYVTVTVFNKVLTRELLASSASGEFVKPKIYSAGPVPLQYISSGNAFDPTTSSHYMYNNVPLIIADGYQKVYGTMPVFYVPPYLSSGAYYGQYLVANSIKGANAANYTITANIPTFTPTATGQDYGRLATTTTQINYGHFVIGIAYSYNISQYNPGTNFYAEVLIKNIWRSPISIYNSYAAYSINDMATKQVVVLFGKTANGGTFLVTNTGTPISSVTNYAVTSLGNFMQIMRAIMNLYDGLYSLVDYFINPSVVLQVNIVQ